MSALALASTLVGLGGSNNATICIACVLVFSLIQEQPQQAQPTRTALRLLCESDEKDAWRPPRSVCAAATAPLGDDGDVDTRSTVLKSPDVICREIGLCDKDNQVPPLESSHSVYSDARSDCVYPPPPCEYASAPVRPRPPRAFA